jgi:hypothetical protein
MIVEQMLQAHPRPPVAEPAVLVRCIDECGECAITCTICADASLAEDDVGAMVRSIRLCGDCADACDETRRIVGRQTDPDPATQREAVEACLAACRACAAECELHAQHREHCRICAEECRRCERACAELLAAL